MAGRFRADIDAFFGSEAALVEFGGRLSGWRLWRHVVPQLVLNPGFLSVALYRSSRWFWPRDHQIVSRLINRFTELVCGIQIDADSDFGPGLEIHHPQGVVMSPKMKIGSNMVIIGAAVTFGIRDIENDPFSQSIEIGDNVTIATGAKVLGPIVIGDNVKIGPNVVLMQDVPSDSIVIVGERPKIISTKKPPASAGQAA